MFAFGFTLVVIILWVRFALGSMNLDVPLGSVQLTRGRIIWTRLLSAGFLVAALAPNMVSTSSLVRLLIEPTSAWSTFLRAWPSCDPPAQSASRNSGKSSEAGDGRPRRARRLERALSWLSLVGLILSSRPTSPVIRREA